MRSLFLVVPVLGLISCGPAPEPNPGEGELGHSEAAIQYRSGRLTCSISATEQSVLSDEHRLETTAATLTYRYASETPDGFVVGAPRGWKPANVSTLFYGEWSHNAPMGAPAWNTHFAQRLVANNGRLEKLQMPLTSPPGQRVLAFREPTAGYGIPWALTSSTRIESGNTNPESFYIEGTPGTGVVNFELNPEETASLLKHLGSRKLTSTKLPMLGLVSVPGPTFNKSCVTKQLHLPPTEDDGLSFHVTFCCYGY